MIKASLKNPALRKRASQFTRLVRHSAVTPRTGQTHKPQLVTNGEMGVTFIGHSSFFLLKITDMQAAVGLAQLDRLDDFVAARRRNWQYLRAALADLEDYFVLPEATKDSEPSWFGFLLTVREDVPFSRDEIVRNLDQNKIGTRFLFGGNLVRQPYMKGRNFRVIGDLPNADWVMRQTFWVGVYPGLGHAQLDYMSDVMHRFCAGAR